MKRDSVLKTAAKLVDHAVRGESHGTVAANFVATADLWNAYILNKPGNGDALTPKDVAMLNILQKMSRSLFNEKHADHYVDMAGYAALAAEVTDAK